MGRFDKILGGSVEENSVKDPYGFIYVITNMINGKRYIGQKKFDSCGRWKKYMGGGYALGIAKEKYGIENFKRDIIYITYSVDESNAVEYEMIEYFNAVKSEDYYNMVDGGDVKNIICNDKIKIICVDDGLIYDSISEAEKVYGLDYSYIKNSFKYNQCLTDKYSRYGKKLEIFREYIDIPKNMFMCRVCAEINKKDSANQKVCKLCSPFYYGNIKDKKFYDSMIKNRKMTWSNDMVSKYLLTNRKQEVVYSKHCKKCNCGISETSKSKFCAKCAKENTRYLQNKRFNK